MWLIVAVGWLLCAALGGPGDLPGAVASVGGPGEGEGVVEGAAGGPSEPLRLPAHLRRRPRLCHTTGGQDTRPGVQAGV